MDTAKIDSIARIVIAKRIQPSVDNRVLKYGGGTAKDVKAVNKRIAELLG